MNVFQRQLATAGEYPPDSTIDPSAFTSQAQERRARSMAEAAEAVEKALSFQFPTCKILPAMYAQIDVPAGLSIPDGYGAWYGLASYTVPSGAANELYWTGYTANLSPPDCSGLGRPAPFAAAAGGWLGWGDTAVGTMNRNTHCYVVFGINLPCTFQTWGPGPRLAGQTGTTAQTYYAPNQLEERRYTTFPPGLFPNSGTTSYSKKSLIENTLPVMMPMSQGTRFDIALCIAPRGLTGLASPVSLACDIVCGAAFGPRYAQRVFTS